MGCREHGWVLDPQTGQLGLREEPAVVLRSVRIAEADQLVVLPVVNGSGAAVAGPGRDRITVLEVVKLTAPDREIGGRVGVVAEPPSAPSRYFALMS